MTYPTSTDVTAGQATAAAQYNNLRSDTLYLGNASTDSDIIANLLANYQTGISLQYLATNKVRVPASAAAPVRIMIGGYMLTAAANVDLAAAPTGGAMWYYVFAVRTAGSTTFTVAINASATESATTRLIGQLYWDGSNVTRLQSKIATDLAANTFDAPFQVCQGRLTLTSGTPITTSNVTAASMLYFTPYQGNYISLYDLGTGWRTWYFSELSLNISGYTAGKNYDIFIYNNAATPALESLVWTNDTTRATALVLQDGRYVKSGDLTRLYLGTIRITAVTGQCEDSAVRRFVYNQYNQVLRALFVAEATNHTYSGSYRKWNNSDTNNLIEWVAGIANTFPFYVDSRTVGVSSNYCALTAVYIDGSVSFSALFNYTANTIEAGNTGVISEAIGYHYAQLYEMGTSASSTFVSMTIQPIMTM